MNVYLDRSKPTYEEYVIIDKDIRTGARQITITTSISLKHRKLRAIFSSLEWEIKFSITNIRNYFESYFVC